MSEKRVLHFRPLENAEHQEAATPLHDMNHDQLVQYGLSAQRVLAKFSRENRVLRRGVPYDMPWALQAFVRGICGATGILVGIALVITAVR